MRESRIASRSSCSANRGTARGSSSATDAQRLGRRLDRGRRGLQLVGGVRDEVATHRLDPAGLGDVADHEQDRPVLAGGRRRGPQPPRGRAPLDLDVAGSDVGRRRAGPSRGGRWDRAVATAVGRRAEVALEGGVREGRVLRRASKSRTPSCIDAEDQVLDLRRPRARTARAERIASRAVWAAWRVRRSVLDVTRRLRDRERHAADRDDATSGPSRSLERAASTTFDERSTSSSSGPAERRAVHRGHRVGLFTGRSSRRQSSVHPRSLASRSIMTIRGGDR